MGLNELIAFLSNYNEWRRGDRDMETPNPKDIGIGIDEAVKILKSLNNE